MAELQQTQVLPAPFIQAAAETYLPQLAEAVAAYFEISKKEAKEYIDMLPKNELENITLQING